MREPVLIIGAGMGGLSAALALLQRGFAVEVYEDAPEIGDVGAGLSIQDSARMAIAGLGLLDVLADDVVTAQGSARRHYRTGEILTETTHPNSDWNIGGPYTWWVHRADLHRVMVEAIQEIDPGCIRLGMRLVDVYQDADGAEARFANGTTARGAALVGADGLRSATRAALFGQEDPRYSGIVAWRGLVPMERIRPELVTPEGCRWIGPDWRILFYPVRGRTLLNYVGSVANQSWQVESWKEHSGIDEMLAAFEGADPTILEVLRETPPELCFKWALFDRDVLPRWSVGRVTLLGDAAHPMLPFLGAGAGMAIEDGLVLARCLGYDSDIVSALARYERLRKPRTDATQLAARANGHWPFDRQFPNVAVAGAAEMAEREREGLPEAYDAATVPL